MENKEKTNLENEERGWWGNFFAEMRKVRWSTMNTTLRTFIITLSVIAIFALLFFGFDALIGLIFNAMGVL